MTAPAEDLDTGADEPSLALDMIEVHGAAASVVARENARIEALAGRAPQAKAWMRILGIIQRRQTAQRAGAALPTPDVSAGPRRSEPFEPEGASS